MRNRQSAGLLPLRLLRLLLLLCLVATGAGRPRVLRAGDAGAADALVAALRDGFPATLRGLAAALSGNFFKLYLSDQRNMIKGVTARPYGTRVLLSDVLDVLDAAVEEGRCRHLFCRRFIYPRISALRVPSLARGIGAFEASGFIGRTGRLRPMFRVSWQRLRWGMHYDNHCNTVVQLKGTKTWRFLRPGSVIARETLESDPNTPGYRHGMVDLFEDDDVWARETVVEDAGAMEITLHEGDMLLVPRGWVHAVQTREEFAASVNWFYECGGGEDYENAGQLHTILSEL
jgi:hypothetical protein